jgi:hypothetical protein
VGRRYALPLLPLVLLPPDELPELPDRSWGQLPFVLVEELPLEVLFDELLEPVDELVLELAGVGDFVAANAWPTPTPPSTVLAARTVVMAPRRSFDVTVVSPPSRFARCPRARGDQRCLGTSREPGRSSR